MIQALHALLATLATTWAVKLPEDATFPALTYQSITGITSGNLGGASTLYNDRVQIDAWARTYEQARALVDQVVEALDGHRSDDFSAVLLTRPRDFFESAPELYRVSVDVSIWHRG